VVFTRTSFSGATFFTITRPNWFVGGEITQCLELKDKKPAPSASISDSDSDNQALLQQHVREGLSEGDYEYDD